MRLQVATSLACLALGTSPAMTAPAPRTQAAIFHIDSMTGDDKADGQSPGTAWRSLDRLNREPLTPGDRALFRRGGLWRGSLRPRSGNVKARVTYGAYGAGPKPILCGSVDASKPDQWISAGKDLWATAPRHFERKELIRDLQDGTWYVHQENGAKVQLKAVPAQGDTPRMYRMDCQASGKARNHIQLWGPPAPTREGESLELQFRARATRPFRTAGIRIMSSRRPYTGFGASSQTAKITEEWQTFAIQFEGIHSSDEGKLHLYLGGALPAGATLFFQPISLHKAQYTGGMSLSVDVGNIIFDGGPTCGFKKWRVEDLTNENDYVYLGETAQVVLRSSENPGEKWDSIELALRRHIVEQSRAQHVTYEDLDLRYGAAHGFGGANTAFLTIRNCDLSYIGGAHQHTRPSGTHVRYGNAIEFWNGGHDNLVEGCRIWEVYDAALTNQGKGNDSNHINITYRNNVIWNSEYSFEYWNRPDTVKTSHILFENNTCIDAGLGWAHNQRPDRNGGHLMFYSNQAATGDFVIRNNLFINSTEVGMRMDTDWSKGLTLSHNLWWNGLGKRRLIRYLIKTYYTAEDFAAFQARSGLGTNALLAEPVFVAPRKRDYRLAPNSPGTTAAHDGGPVGARPLK